MYVSHITLIRDSPAIKREVTRDFVSSARKSGRLRVRRLFTREISVCDRAQCRRLLFPTVTRTDCHRRGSRYLTFRREKREKETRRTEPERRVARTVARICRSRNEVREYLAHKSYVKKCANPTYGTLAKTSRVAAMNNDRCVPDESIRYYRNVTRSRYDVSKITETIRAPHVVIRRFSRCR